MKTLWWFVLCLNMAAMGVLIAGLVEGNFKLIMIGGVLTGLCVIAMQGVDNYVNKGTWT